MHRQCSVYVPTIEPVTAALRYAPPIVFSKLLSRVRTAFKTYGQKYLQKQKLYCSPTKQYGGKKKLSLNYLQPTILLYASGAVQKDELGNT